MKKIFSLILFGLLCINTSALCKEQKALQYKSEPVQQKVTLKENEPVKKVVEQKDAAVQEDAAKEVTQQKDTVLNENDMLNLDDNSFTITDEQFQEAKNMAEFDDDNETLDKKIINSSHFTVGTPSKTYNPLNKSIGGNK